MWPRREKQLLKHEYDMYVKLEKKNRRGYSLLLAIVVGELSHGILPIAQKAYLLHPASSSSNANQEENCSRRASFTLDKQA